MSVVYSSSYDRGLEPILRFGWPHLLAAFPSLKLQLYYGWRTHQLSHPESKWRRAMKQLLRRLRAR